jgi:putative MATE family efflux protein
LFLRIPLLNLLNTPPESFKETNHYLTTTITGIIFIFGYNALAAILRGMGNSKQPFYFVLISCVVNVILDFLFEAVFHLRALGAGLASVISQALSVYLCIRYLRKHNFHFDFRRISSYKIYWPRLVLIIKHGLPACIQNTVVNLSFMFITSIVNVVGGVSASASVGAISKFRRFASLPVISIGTSISAISAQNFGAGLFDRAKEACKFGIIFSVIISYIFFALVQIFPDSILRIFGDDPAMIQDGVTFLRSYTFDLLLFPFVYCINSFLIGGGHTLFALINSIFSSILLRAPACYFFGITLGWGLTGVGLGTPVTSAWVLAAIIIFLKSGVWKRRYNKNKSDAGKGEKITL